MTLAELHGKISRTGINLHDQLEDLLTSDRLHRLQIPPPPQPPPPLPAHRQVLTGKIPGAVHPAGRCGRALQVLAPSPAGRA